MPVKIDVAVSVYGKLYQTAVMLASLFEHSGKFIDRIFFQEELVQPGTTNVSQLIGCFPGRDFIHYRPEHYLGWSGTERSQLGIPAYRRSIRYQYAWETTDKDFLFVTHNDCVFDTDIVGGMLSKMQEHPYTGVGLIGQCWNCPASMEGVCNGDIRQHYAPTFLEVETMLRAYPDVRTTLEMIDPASPAPLPECRLNEFACLINVGACRSQVLPLGDIVPFGFMNLDIGTEWFRQLVLRGHQFLNWRTGFDHSPFSSRRNGHEADLSDDEYALSEQRAQQYLTERFPEVAANLSKAHGG